MKFLLLVALVILAVRTARADSTPAQSNPLGELEQALDAPPFRYSAGVISTQRVERLGDVVKDAIARLSSR